MLNKDIYQRDWSQLKLENEGVANVNDDNLKVLRYELETFVCDGQYEKGLSHILDTYLKNTDRAQQPGVWVSGFFGSGKSHLVKMLRALWINTEFSDKATARSLVKLPDSVKDALQELSNLAKSHGGLHAASGTLGAGASGSVRLALLQIVFKSVGLPANYPVAKFVMWLKKEGLLEKTQKFVKEQGDDWEEELANFHVAEGLYKALCQVAPAVFSPSKPVADILPLLYPNVTDVGADDMVTAVKQALTRDGKFPLTLIALDEVQQFIGSDGERSIQVQEMVEFLTKTIGGKLLFVGTGQTAITDTGNLARLQGRFTIRVELSENDVDKVVRQVILAKKPEHVKPLEEMMKRNIGEISRQLAGTTIAHREDDIPFFSQDYPILPVRRRFWELAMRALDKTGTDSQLRNQLSMVHKVVLSNREHSLGNVVPADALYFEAAERLMQSRTLPRKVYDNTTLWMHGKPEEKLLARACGLIFLINKLSGANKEVGIRATAEAVADLLVEDLNAGSANIRNQLPKLLDNCDCLIKVKDEYRIQTAESAAWTDEFENQKAQLANASHRIEAERCDRIKNKYGELTRNLNTLQGKSKEPREFPAIFRESLDVASRSSACIWVRDGWSVDENTVLVDARQAGQDSPVIFVFVPKRSSDELRTQIIDLKAATATLDKKGVPNGPEGQEAKAYVETIRQSTEGRLNELLAECFAGAKVFQGGGKEITGSNLLDSLQQAGQNALVRMYPEFDTADHSEWGKVYDKAKQGAPDALKHISYNGEPIHQPVCKAILSYIGAAKKGLEIRDHFKDKPYGWPQDAIDGGLQVLLVATLVKVLDDKGSAVNPTTLERKAIGKSYFKPESPAVSATQRIEVRKVLQKMVGPVKSGEEQTRIPEFIEKVQQLADLAGGIAPKPEAPDAAFLADIKKASGNEQLMVILNSADELLKKLEDWKTAADRIAKRWPSWEKLQRLAGYARQLSGADAVLKQVKAIEDGRMLLNEPDPITPLLNNLTQMFRDELNLLSKSYDTAFKVGNAKLEADANWNKLEPEQRQEILGNYQLTPADAPEIKVDTADSVLASLDSMPLSALKDRLDALQGRFSTAIQRAAEKLEPKAQRVDLPSRTLKNEAEIDLWLKEVGQLLKTKVKNGPIIF